MSLTQSTLWGGVSAVLSSVVCMTLTPFMATIGFCNGPCATWLDKPLVIRTAGRWLASEGWFSFAPGSVLYFSYGRYFFLVYLLIIFGLLAFHTLQGASTGQIGRSMRRSYRLLLASLILAGMGDFVSYGIGVFSELAWRIGFGVEVLSLLGIIVGSVWYGVTTLRRHALPSWTGAVLVVAGLVIPVMFFDHSLVMYMPNAPMLPYSLLWLLLGGFLLARAFSMRTRPTSSLTS